MSKVNFSSVNLHAVFGNRKSLSACSTSNSTALPLVVAVSVTVVFFALAIAVIRYEDEPLPHKSVNGLNVVIGKMCNSSE